MLETIREYAAEQLAASPEAEAVARAHATWFRDLAESCEDVLTAPDWRAKLDQLDLELANFRTAVKWSLRSGDLDQGLRLMAALRTFWYTRNHLTESRRAFDLLLAASAAQGATPLRARALSAASELASWHTDYRAAYELAVANLRVAEEVGDQGLIGMAKVSLGWATVFMDPDAARALFEEAMAIARPMQDDVIMVGALQGHALAHIRLGNFSVARPSAVEALDTAARSGDHYINAMNLLTLGTVDERLGDEPAAIRSYTAALRMAQDAGGHIGLALALDAIAHVGIAHDDVVRGVQLAAAAARLRTELGGSTSMEMGGWQEPLEHGRSLLPSDAYDQAVAAGHALSVEEAFALGLAVAADAAAGPASARV
jgi:tetratricopeptide (TPR) repeat protein